MKKSELKALIREVIKEVMFPPMNVAVMKGIQNSTKVSEYNELLSKYAHNIKRATTPSLKTTSGAWWQEEQLIKLGSEIGKSKEEVLKDIKNT